MEKIVDGYICNDMLVFVEPEWTDEQKKLAKQARSTVRGIHSKYKTKDPIVMMDRNITQKEMFVYLAARKFLRTYGLEEE